MPSVRERRRSDGTRSSAVLWRDPETGRQTSLTYDDERDAIIAKQLIEAAGGHAIEAARIAEAVRRTGPTVTEAVSDHIDLLTAVGPDARAHYRGQLAAHITPSLGPYPVAAMTYRHIAGWVRMMGEKGLALKTVANVRGLLSVAMTTAVRLGYRADNPCTGVELPKSQATRDERKVLTRAEFGLLLSHIPAFYQPLVLTLAATGLRWGEATALTAGDVDLGAQPPTLRVTKAWKRDADRHWYVGPPKRLGLDVEVEEVDLDLESVRYRGRRLTEARADAVAQDVLSRTPGRPSLSGTGEKSPSLTIRLPAAKRAQLDALASKEQRRASDLVREALDDYLRLHAG